MSFAIMDWLHRPQGSFMSVVQGLIRLLSTCASGSTLATKTLLVLGISGILKDILAGSGLVSSISASPALNRPPEQIFMVYPAWRWFEKEDGIRSLQKNSKDPAPEFYNIFFERPKGDDAENPPKI